MSIKYLSPVDVVIQEFGGVRAAARAINDSESLISHTNTASVISQWRKPRKHLAAGSIPVSYMIKILRIAKANGKNITGEDLILGREVACE